MKLNQMLAIAGLGALMLVGSTTVMAQGRGGFDPAQMRERMITRLREQMDVKDDAEWKAIEGQISKVMDARRDTMASEFGGFGGGSRGPRPGSTDANSSSTSSSSDQGSSRRRSSFFGEPAPETEALRKAVDDKASSDEIQAKLSAMRKANKAKQQKLEKAQADLKAILSPRQEAVAVLNGLLK
ncbi:MAG: hypothetical protein JWO95_177 [Verrucomicrobiales bacterium]|nr:hypothetical protein [Verrucomicrobiales bacterium]